MTANMKAIGKSTKDLILTATTVEQWKTANELVNEIIDTVDIYPKQDELDMVTDLSMWCDFKINILNTQN